MEFTAQRQSEILSAIDAVAALVTETTTQDTLTAQIAQLTAERDAALAQAAELQTRLTGIVADIQALNAADAQEDAARAAILAKAQGN